MEQKEGNAQSQGQMNDAAALAEFVHRCTVPVAVIGGRLHAARQLNVAPPPEFVPEAVLELKRRWDAGAIVRDPHHPHRFADTLKHLRRYHLLPPKPKTPPLTAAERCKRWRQKRFQTPSAAAERPAAHA